MIASRRASGALLAAMLVAPLTTRAAEDGPQLLRVPAVASGTGDWTLLVSPAHAGRLGVGRYTLVIPAGVFGGRASVRLVVPDSTTMTCTIEVDPPVRGPFPQALTLEADLHGVQPPAEMVAIAYEDSLGGWKLMDGLHWDAERSVASVPVVRTGRYALALWQDGW